jgi:hypothetical protein
VPFAFHGRRATVVLFVSFMVMVTSGFATFAAQVTCTMDMKSVLARRQLSKEGIDMEAIFPICKEHFTFD